MYTAPVEEIAFTLKHVAGLAAELDAGTFGDLSEDLVDAILVEAGRFAGEEVAPLASGRRPRGRGARRRAGDDAARLEGTLSPLARGRLERPFRARRLWRPGAADHAFCGGDRDVERRLHGLRHRADAHHGRGGDDRAPRRRGPQGALSREAGVRRMDGHHEPHRAAGRLGPRRAEVPSRAGRRRHLSPVRPEDLHHLWRPRPDRQHRPPGAGPPAGRAAGHPRPVALPGAQGHPCGRRRRSAGATTSSAPAWRTSSASTPRPLAPWSMATASRATRPAPWPGS